MQLFKVPVHIRVSNSSIVADEMLVHEIPVQRALRGESAVYLNPDKPKQHGGVPVLDGDGKPVNMRAVEVYNDLMHKYPGVDDKVSVVQKVYFGPEAIELFYEKFADGTAFDFEDDVSEVIDEVESEDETEPEEGGEEGGEEDFKPLTEDEKAANRKRREEVIAALDAKGIEYAKQTPTKYLEELLAQHLE